MMTQGSLALAQIILNRSPLEQIEEFCYLGLTVSGNYSLDSKIILRIRKAITTSGRLTKRVWNSKRLYLSVPGF